MKHPRRWILLIALSLCALGGFWVYQWLFVDLPSLDRLTQNLAPVSTKILARDGRVLYTIPDPAGINHAVLPLAEMPLALQQATIATEDATFYTNPGVDGWGILRSFWINLTGGEVLAGGSTLTQQVARNMLLDPQERAERTLQRKLRESLLAWRLTQAYSKDQILELYLNQTYYGHLAYGVEAAAQTYFGKSARELDLAEAALIAGLPQAPSHYDPLLYPEAARARQAVVLDLLVKQGSITAAAAQTAKAETLHFTTDPFPIEAPHFVFYVWNLLEQRYGPEVLYSGLTVTTTLDLDLTRAAQASAHYRLGELAAPPGDDQAPHNATNAALVALDPRTGQILALLGSPDYFDESIAGAINFALAPRQPGSAIKPLTYAAAFSPEFCANPTGNCPWSPATPLLDVRTSFITREGFSYVPFNHDRQFHGPVSARAALGRSLNLPAVLTLQHVGLDPFLQFALRLGLTTLTDADRFGLALTLGGGEVRLLDLTSAYATFANGGWRAEPVALLEVRAADGTLITRWEPAPPLRVLDERVAFLINDILSDNRARAETFGPNSVLQIGRPAAAKTGTTTDYRDNWTMGYTPELVVGVWVGNADYSPMAGLSGVDGAGPIWHDFMRVALEGKPVTTFARPTGLTEVEVCWPSGLLPTPHCRRTQRDWFLTEAIPTQPDDWYQLVRLDTRTGQLAAPATPPEFVQEQVFLVLPPAAQEWARENGIAQPPTGIGVPGAESVLQLTSPDPQTVYQISPRLPLASQQILFSAQLAALASSVTFRLDGQVLATFTAGPYEWWWPLAPGPHTLVAEATLTTGETVTEQLQFTVLP